MNRTIKNAIDNVQFGATIIAGVVGIAALSMLGIAAWAVCYAAVFAIPIAAVLYVASLFGLLP